MNSALYVDDLVKRLNEQVKNGGVPLSDAMWETALACVGFPYVFGAWGALCTVKERKYRLGLNPSHTTIKTKCQVMRDDNPKPDCSGCQWFPNGERVRCYDCRGFTDWILKQFGFDLEGEGATSQWNSKKNWCKKGSVKDGIPQNVICCLFYENDAGKMAHTGLYFNGQTCECSNGVQYSKTLNKKWTKYAVPACFADLMGLPQTEPQKEPEKEPAKEQTKVYKTIRKGNMGSLVKDLQTMLSKLGYDLGICGIDGDFGIATQNAVKDFQRTHKDENGKPLTVDGVVGAKTWTALEKAVADPAPPVVYYTVTVTRLTESESDALLKEYKNATRTVEKG